ncbi:MAG: LD-carboxypeptidase, partial [Pyrinomonadaceae bacterium]|nr:LD-carboxypeptidase [Pyrinomonadaceae bacterium]
MKRRNFLAGAGAALAAFPLLRGSIDAQTPSTNYIRPKALRPGDTVGIITPSTPVIDPDRLAVVERTMKYFKLRWKMGKNVGRRSVDYKSFVDERLDDLHAMFSDPQISAIFALRGGYGAPQLLDRIDYDLIRRNPKIFLGFSDITALHLAIHKRAGLVT